MPYTEHERQILLGTAWRSIRSGLDAQRRPPIDGGDCPAALRVEAASFVSLHRGSELRGCIGSLEATRPLIEDVAQNAYAAAFRDPRFDGVKSGDMAGLLLHIAVLSEPQALRFDSETALLTQLRAGVDGLIIADNGRRATFLPSVWETLQQPGEFLLQLKRKAGLRPDHWSEEFKAWRYTTESFAALERQVIVDTESAGAQPSPGPA